MSQIIVVQIGARHHYAIPRILHQAELLERLYTDSCANRGLGLWCRRLIPKYFLKGNLKRLIQREIKDIPPNKIFSTDVLFTEMVYQRIHSQDIFNYQIMAGRKFSKKLIKWGVGEAKWIYSMFGEGFEFLEYGKQQDLKIALDIFINPITHRIIRTERDKFPEWEPQFPKEFDIKIEEHVNKLIALADILICPSNAVVAGLSVFPDFRSEKIRLVPYGSGILAQNNHNQPVAGRILFAGSANLRKGIQYLANATQYLSKKGKRFEFRVAGEVTETIRSRPECKFINFLGLIPRQQMVDEFQHADVFVLPTLAEGSASVVSEALAFGLPVITTPSAGSLIENGIDGLIIPERDSQALADGIQMVVENRDMRERLAYTAKQAITKYIEEAWRERLVKVFEGYES